jgi:hypothetical protein
VRTRITCNRATYLLPRSHDRSSRAPWLHGHTPPSPLCHPCHRRLKQARLKRVLCQDVVPAGPPPRYNCFHFPLQNPSPKFILTLTCLECSTRLGGLWDPLHCTLRFGVSLLAGFAHLEVIIFDFHQPWHANGYFHQSFGHLTESLEKVLLFHFALCLRRAVMDSSQWTGRSSRSRAVYVPC